jgi:hypothetical protein
MTKDKLNILITQALFEYITDYTFEVNDNKHLVCLFRPAGKVKTPGLELVHTVGAWVQFLFVVDKLRELVLHACVIVV